MQKKMFVAFLNVALLSALLLGSPASAQDYEFQDQLDEYEAWLAGYEAQGADGTYADCAANEVCGFVYGAKVQYDAEGEVMTDDDGNTVLGDYEPVPNVQTTVHYRVQTLDSEGDPNAVLAGGRLGLYFIGDLNPDTDRAVPGSRTYHRKTNQHGYFEMEIPADAAAAIKEAQDNAPEGVETEVVYFMSAIASGAGIGNSFGIGAANFRKNIYGVNFADITGRDDVFDGDSKKYGNNSVYTMDYHNDKTKFEVVVEFKQ